MNETTLNRVEDTLHRLGIEELEQRLELSPVVVGGEGPLGADGCCSNLCTCEVTLPEQILIPDNIR